VLSTLEGQEESTIILKWNIGTKVTIIISWINTPHPTSCTTMILRVEQFLYKEDLKANLRI